MLPNTTLSAPDYILVCPLPDLNPGAVFQYSPNTRFYAEGEYMHQVDGDNGYYFPAKLVQSSYFFEKFAPVNLSSLPRPEQFKLNLARHEAGKSLNQALTSTFSQLSKN